MNSCIIIDIDGTVADNEHRVHLVKSKPKRWDVFHDRCVDDTVNEYVAEIARAFYYGTLTKVFFCSGRPQSHELKTRAWFNNFAIPFHELLMRPTGDTRPDTIIKKEMLDQIRGWGYTPLFAIDDRPTVIQMWRENGVPCLAMDDVNWR